MATYHDAGQEERNRRQSYSPMELDHSGTSFGSVVNFLYSVLDEISDHTIFSFFRDEKRVSACFHCSIRPIEIIENFETVAH